MTTKRELKVMITTALQPHSLDEELFALALTHSSANSVHNNERLEFLGDAALGLAISTLLMDAFPRADEGRLTKMRARIVSRQFLSSIASHWKLTDAIQASGTLTRTMAGDALEALFGMVHLTGGFDATKRLAHAMFCDEITAIAGISDLRDAKTQLNEWLQHRQQPVATYDAVQVDGVSQVTAYVHRDGPHVQTHASRRRDAEQEAAKLLLATLKQS